jgi:hypothetical protein
MICDTARTALPHQIIVAWPKSCRDFPVDEINAERRSSQPEKVGADKGRREWNAAPLFPQHFANLCAKAGAGHRS